MGELIKAITSSAPLLAVTVVIVIVATVTLLAVFVVAFAQGRSIAFWPPSIGERPKPASVLTEVPSPQAGTTSKPAASVRGAESWPPVAGSVFTTSSGAQYVMEDRLSVGGVSVIYRAAALNNREQPVVIKALWIGPEPDAEILRAFSNEARATARLKHPNIAAPYDSGTYAGYPFLVMEFFTGGSLHAWLSTHDQMRGQDIISVARQVFSAVDYAHQQGVIHRDLKPGNILFESDPQGRVALADFGIARIVGAAQIPITGAVSMAGTLTYISPEALRSQPVSFATDIYSCGVILYEMIAGTPPFSAAGGDFGSIIGQILSGAPDIRKRKSSVSHELAERIGLALHSDPQQRPVSATAILAGIERDLLVLH